MGWRKVVIIAKDALGTIAAVVVLLSALAIVNRIWWGCVDLGGARGGGGKIENFDCGPRACNRVANMFGHALGYRLFEGGG